MPLEHRMKPYLASFERCFDPGCDANGVRAVDPIGIAFKRGQQVTGLGRARRDPAERSQSTVLNPLGELGRVIEPVLGVEPKDHRRVLHG